MSGETEILRAIESYAPSSCSWDLEVKEEGKKPIKIQVKTVSDYSKTSRISPIHRGYDQLVSGSLAKLVKQRNALCPAEVYQTADRSFSEMDDAIVYRSYLKRFKEVQRRREETDRREVLMHNA